MVCSALVRFVTCDVDGLSTGPATVAESIGGNFYHLRTINNGMRLDYENAVNGQNAQVHVCGNDVLQPAPFVSADNRASAPVDQPKIIQDQQTARNPDDPAVFEYVEKGAA